MSNDKRMVWLGPVRLDAFKACAKLLGRALGVTHCRSLDALARAFGWLSFSELNCHPDLGESGGICVTGSFDEIYDLWCGQVIASYGLESRSELDVIDRLQRTFRRVLRKDPLARNCVGSEHQCGGESPRNVRDPMLRAGNWRDAEFRQWIGQIVDRGKPDGRNYDDLCGAAERESESRLEDEFA